SAPETGRAKAPAGGSTRPRCSSSSRGLAQVAAADQHGPYRIAFAQEGAGARHHQIAVAEAFTHLHQRAGGEPRLDSARLDPAGPHLLHARALAAVENGRRRYGETLAVSGHDDRAGKCADPETRIVAEEDAHPPEPGGFVNLRRDEADVAFHRAQARNL